MALRPRHLRRYRQIAEVLVRHGFGAVVAELELDQYLDWPRWWTRTKPPSSTELTPARHVRLALEELGPTFVKLGQILSTRPDLLPPPYVNELSNLQDNVKPSPWEPIKACIEKELEDSLESLFCSVNEVPIAAASLAQVHGAVLHDGRNVVIKVQRPNIEKIVEIDLDILYDLAHLAQDRTPLGDYYNLVDLAEEFSASLRAELDYRREGRNAERFQDNFAGEPHLYVPAIYWDYSTRRVLVQERIHGIKIDNIAALDAAGYDRRRIALHSAHFIVKEILEDGFFHADPHPGNIVIMPGEVIGLMDFGTVGHLHGNQRTDLVKLYIVAVRLDAEGIVEQLLRMGIAGRAVDRAALQRDIHRILLKYYHLPLNEISANDVLEEIEPIIYRYHLHLPTDLWLLLKTLVVMEGVGKSLDPTFDIFEVSKPYVERFMVRMWLPTEWGPAFIENATGWTDLLARLPGQTHRILDQVEHGELSFRLDLPLIDKATNRMDRIANRVILSVLLAALIVALAMLIPILDLDWPWSFITWVVMISFAVMSVLALWLIASILRSGGKP